MIKALVLGLMICPLLYAQTDSLQAIGMQYLSEGRYKESVRTLLQAGADTGTSFQRSQLGLAYAGMNDFANARRHLSESVALSSGDVPRRFLYARFLHMNLLLNDAFAQYSEVVRLDSTYGAAWFQLGQISRLLGATDSVQAAYYESALKLNQEDYLSLYYLGSILLDEIDTLRGIDLLQASLSRNTQFLPASERLASHYYAMNMNSMAIQYYRLCGDLRPKNPEFRFYLGELFRRLRQTDSAAVHFRAAIALDSSKSSYHAQLGYTYFLADKFDSSASSYRNAIKLDDDISQYYLNLALALEREDSVDAAATALKGAILALDPHQIGLVYEKLGGVYYRANKSQLAIGAYEKSLTYFPENREAMFYLAMAFEQGLQVNSAIQAYRRYLRLLSNEPEMNARFRFIEDRIRILESAQKK